MPSTADLVKAAQAGDTAAFTELVIRYEKVAVITAHAILHDFHASQDAAQDAFVLAYKKLSQIRDASSFGPWLLKIVRRGCLRLQKTKTAELISPEVIDGVIDTETDWMAPYADAIEQLAQLPEQEKIVVVMRYIEHYSVKDIAESLDAPVGTVTKQISRAIQRLRTWLVEVEL